MNSASPLSCARWGALLVILIFLVIPAQPAGAQYCMEYDPPDPFDTSSDCRARPENHRTFFPVVREWNGSEFLFHSRGNELEIMTLNDPENPVRFSRSTFSVGNVGDADYELYRWGSCDDCRYGYSVHTLAGVFFDLGGAASPAFVDYDKFYEYPDLVGGLTFKHDGTQYLIMDQIGNGVCGLTSGLFVFDGTNPDALPFVDCVYKPDDVIFRVSGGLYLQDNRYNGGDAYLWLSDSSKIFIYKLVKTGGPTSLQLQFVKEFDWGSYNAGAIGGFAIDFDRGLAVTTTYAHGLKVWQVSDLRNPQLKATRSNVLANWLTLGDGVVVAGAYGDNSPLFSFDLSVLTNPTPLDQEYWDQTQPWNDLPCWGGNLGATFTRDGDYLFTSRWEMMQRHDFRGCGGPQAPTARATLGRWNGSTCSVLVGSVFPGDDICAKSDSSGDISTTDIWITDAGGTTVASTSGGATAGPLPYAIPVGGAAGETDRLAFTEGCTVRRTGDGHRRQSVCHWNVFHVQQGRPSLAPVVRLCRSLTRAGDNDHQRVATRPTRAAHNLFNDRGDVRGPLIEASLSHRQPRQRRPRHRSRRSEPGGYVPLGRGERGRPARFGASGRDSEL